MGAFHTELPAGFIHRTPDQNYANVAARDADTAYSTNVNNLFKTVYIEDLQELQMLISVTPTWVTTMSGPTPGISTVLLVDQDIDGVFRNIVGINNASLQTVFYDVTAADYTQKAGFDIDETLVSIGRANGDGAGAETTVQEIDFQSGAMTVKDTVNTRGLQYDADYSGNFLARSLVDKAYVDGQVDDSIYNNDGSIDNLTRTFTGTTSPELRFNLFDLNGSNYLKKINFELEGLGEIRLLLENGNGLGTSTAFRGFLIDNNDFIAWDSITNKGIIYDNDYSANFVARSLIDKAYSDSFSIYLNNGTIDNVTRTFTGINDAEFKKEFHDLTTSNFTKQFALFLGGASEQITLAANTGDGLGAITGTSGIQLDTSTMLVFDSINTKGLEYSADYSSNFTARSLIDKAYSDSFSIYLNDGTIDNLTRTFTGQNNSSLDFRFYDLLPTTFTKESFLAIDGDEIFMSVVTGDGAGNETDFSGFRFTTAFLQIFDGINDKGIEYELDYSDNFTARSLVDKAYVDNEISLISQAPPNTYVANALQNFTFNGISSWTTNLIVNPHQWQDVIWVSELGLFVAVASDGTPTQVMTSPDGVTWTARNEAFSRAWVALTYAPSLGLLCAVSNSNINSGVMTSSDGITWNIQFTASNQSWFDIAWSEELGLFVIVGTSGTATSTDGVFWTNRTSASSAAWGGVVWAKELGLFVACAKTHTGTAGAIQTSPDGITWTSRTAALNQAWEDIVWSKELGLLVCVSSSGTTQRVQTSPDGITWTARTTPNQNFARIAWSRELGLFLSPGIGTNDSLMGSEDGITWTAAYNLVSNALVSCQAIAWSLELEKFLVLSFSMNESMISRSPTEFRLQNLEVDSLIQPISGTDTGLICDIPISETTGVTQYDRGPVGSDGTSINGVLVSDNEGRFGAGGVFDGVDQYIELDDSKFPFGTAPRTLLIQAKTNSIIGDAKCFAYGSEDTNETFFLGRLTDQLHLGGFNNDIFIDSFWENGVWHDFAMTFTGTIVEVWVDGKKIISEAKAWSTVSSGNAYIGRMVPNQSSYWDGNLANFRAYDRVLADEEIRTAYLKGSKHNSSSVITADKFRVLDTSDTIQTVSLLADMEVEVFEASDIDDLATAGVITISNSLTLHIKSQNITTGTRFVLSLGGSLTILGNYTSDPLTIGNTLTYSGTGDFVSGYGSFFTDQFLGLASSSTGQLFDIVNYGTGIISVVNTALTGWDNLGSIKNSLLLAMIDTGIQNVDEGLELDSIQAVQINSVAMLNFAADENVFELADTSQIGLSFEMSGVGGVIPSDSNIIRVDPGVPNKTSFSFVANAFQGGSLFDDDDTGDDSGTFTAIADASVASTNITSVAAGAGGIEARFTFAAGPTLYVGQEVVLTGFATVPFYNGTHIITATNGTSTFDIATLPFLGTDTGSFTSASVTVTATQTLVTGQSLTIKGDDTTDYDGGAIIYNVSGTAFQINRTFAATETGQWIIAWLDQQDPRILAKINPASIDSASIGCITMVNETEIISISSSNTWFDLDLGGNVDEASNIERWKLVDDIAGTIMYTGKEPFSGSIVGTFSIDSPGSQNYAFRYVKEPAAGGGFVALPDGIEIPFATDSASGTFPANIPITAEIGDKFKPQVENRDGEDDITFTDLSIGPKM